MRFNPGSRALWDGPLFPSACIYPLPCTAFLRRCYSGQQRNLTRDAPRRPSFKPSLDVLSHWLSGSKKERRAELASLNVGVICGMLLSWQGWPTFFFTARDAASTANRNLFDARWGFACFGTQLPASNEMTFVCLLSSRLFSVVLARAGSMNLKFVQAQRVIGSRLDPFLLLI